MKQQAGEKQTHASPLVGYHMFGVPCANCAFPMEAIWVFKDRLEVWHIGTGHRCYMEYVVPTDIPIEVPEKKPDGRKLPRRYARCKRCGVRFAKPRNGILVEEGQDLCKACRNQQELFTYDEITEPKDGVSTDTQ